MELWYVLELCFNCVVGLGRCCDANIIAIIKIRFIDLIYCGAGAVAPIHRDNTTKAYVYPLTALVKKNSTDSLRLHIFT